MVGARGDMIDVISEQLVREDNVNLVRAKELMAKFIQEGQIND
jgi:transcription antitermination factor NusA-like protein